MNVLDRSAIHRLLEELDAAFGFFSDMADADPDNPQWQPGGSGLRAIAGIAHTAGFLSELVDTMELEARNQAYAHILAALRELACGAVVETSADGVIRLVSVERPDALRLLIQAPSNDLPTLRAAFAAFSQRIVRIYLGHDGHAGR